MLVPFASRTRSATSLAVDTEHLINCYPEYEKSGRSKSVAALYGVPGYSLFANLGAFPCRGWRDLGDYTYAVFRNELHRIDAAGSSTIIGTLTTSTGRVGIDHNGTDLVIFDGTNGYSYEPGTGTFTDFTANSIFFPKGATHVAHLDGFMIAAPATLNPQRFYASDSETVKVWNAAQFATAERQDDPLVGVITDHTDAFLFGTKTVEVWNNSGTGSFPFARQSGISLQWGLAAPRAVTKYRDSIAFLGFRGNDNALRVIGMEGYSPVSLSNPYIETQLRSYASISDCVASTYSVGGHDFMSLHFAGAGVCWNYDSQTGEWHERRHGPASVGRSAMYLPFQGKTLAADHENGKIYTVETTTYEDAGDELHFIARGGIISNDEERISHAALEAVWERGVGTVTGQGQDPQAQLGISDDGGQTWRRGLFRPMGKIGETKARTRWLRLGRPRNRVYELTVTDPVKRVLVGVKLTAGR